MSHCKEGLDPFELETIDAFAFMQYIWKKRMNSKINNFKISHEISRVKLPKENLNYLALLDLCIEFIVSLCDNILNEEFWLTLREVVILQLSIFPQHIQREFYVDEQTFQTAVNYLSTCKEDRNQSASNETAIDVVDPSTFLPALEGFSESQDDVNNDTSNIENATTTTPVARTIYMVD